MLNRPETKHAATGAAESRHRPTAMNLLQIVIGLLLVTASAAVVSTMPHTALVIPALMGGLLLFQGGRPYLVGRKPRTVDEHERPTGHILG